MPYHTLVEYMSILPVTVHHALSITNGKCFDDGLDVGVSPSPFNKDCHLCINHASLSCACMEIFHFPNILTRKPSMSSTRN